MKAQIAAKYIQFLSNKKANKNSGFTLIELLVVIIIIGILSAIALPSFLNQAAKARASEARTNIGSMNGGQQAYYLQAQKFAIDDPAGESGIKKMGFLIPCLSVSGLYWFFWIFHSIALSSGSGFCLRLSSGIFSRHYWARV